MRTYKISHGDRTWTPDNREEGEAVLNAILAIIRGLAVSGEQEREDSRRMLDRAEENLPAGIPEAGLDVRSAVV